VPAGVRAHKQARLTARAVLLKYMNKDINISQSVSAPETRKQPRIPRAGDDTRPSNYRIPQAWADWIESLSSWKVFGHYTFRDYPHPENAEKTWRLYIHKINRKLFGQNYWKHKETKGITWARGSELQRRGAIHYHALLGNISGDIDTRELKEMWWTIGGICRVWIYQAHLGAEYYMSKNTYAWKSGEVDIGGPVNQLPIQ
jgi:hypothetical protein